jgi:hypothetical protein
MDSDKIEITITVDRSEAASMTHGARERWLGKRAESQLAGILPPRPPMGGSRNNRWKPYSRPQLAQAFSEWASLNDGSAPAKQDWSFERDPEGRWPRAGSDSFKKAVKAYAHNEGIHLSRWAPHLDDPEHQARRAWHDARALTILPDGRVEQSQASNRLGSKIDEVAARWDATQEERDEIEALLAAPEPEPYCEDCFHGGGCRPADMGYWQYAVEVIGGLQLRQGNDFAATRSRRSEFGRNRQMVTAGAADTYPSPSDPAVGSVIETIRPGR